MMMVMRMMAMRRYESVRKMDEDDQVQQRARERRKSLQLEYMHRQKQSMEKLNAGGLELAADFALACGVRESGDVFQAARIFRKQKTREFW
jgi:hypothetical protein